MWQCSDVLHSFQSCGCRSSAELQLIYRCHSAECGDGEEDREQCQLSELLSLNKLWVTQKSCSVSRHTNWTIFMTCFWLCPFFQGLKIYLFLMNYLQFKSFFLLGDQSVHPPLQVQSEMLCNIQIAWKIGFFMVHLIRTDTVYTDKLAVKCKYHRVYGRCLIATPVARSFCDNKIERRHFWWHLTF